MGKLAQIKTKETEASVSAYLQEMEDKQKRDDCFKILEIMQKATGDEPKLWGSSIIGFGNLRYKSPNTGREVDWFKLGFAPRKANISIYLMELDKKALEKLGKHKTGVGCLYINKLADIDLKVLTAMINAAAKKKK